MKKNLLVKGLVTSVIAMSAVNSFAVTREDKELVTKLCAKYEKMDSSVAYDEVGSTNSRLKSLYEYSCVDVAREKKQAELEKAYKPVPRTTIADCLDVINANCHDGREVWKKEDLHRDAKCLILKKKGTELTDSVVLYSLNKDVISVFPVLANNQRCGQIQLTSSKDITSVSKFGERIAVAAGGQLFEMHNTITGSNTNGKFTVNEILNQDKDSYSSVKVVEDSAMEDTMNFTTANNRTYKLEKEDLGLKSERMVKLGTYEQEYPRHELVRSFPPTNSK